MREGLRTILDLEPGLQVVGEAADGQAGLEAAARLLPEVVLMDMEMPRLDGVAATRQLLQRFPAMRVVLLTTFDYDSYILEGIRAGARGYLLKSAPAADLVDTIRRVHAGEVFIQYSIWSGGPAIDGVGCPRPAKRHRGSRNAQRTGGGRVAPPGPGEIKPGDRDGTRHHRGHCEESCLEYPGQAEGRQPHRSRQSRPPAAIGLRRRAPTGKRPPR